MKFAKKLLCILLIVCMLLTGTVVVSAKADELYLEDIRIVYAESYEEAQKILQNTEFKEYTLLNYNLNATATKVDLGLVTIGDGNGVFLAYKTTTNVDDAITDVAIMQMDGGYRMGNYQEMLKKSREQYKKVGETYLTAINYMIEAYYAGDFRATAAYRQLELYKDGERKDGDTGMTLGALFETQPGADALAKIFLEGNMHAIRNIRALIGMGVSYNEDGMTYLEKVTEAAAEMDTDETVFEGEDYEALAELISKSIVTFREMLKEYATVEAEFNYEDDVFSDGELKYAEHAALASMFRDTTYLGGATLYDFCLGYQLSVGDYTSLFPLVHALNEGQKAVTTAGNYYDAIRYSMSEMPMEFMHEEICKMEEKYANKPFNLYTGVDRSIYKSSFALTSEAYRADVSGDKDFFDSLYYDEDVGNSREMEFLLGTVGTGVFVWAIFRTKDAAALQKTYDAAVQAKTSFFRDINNFKSTNEIVLNAADGGAWQGSAADFVDELMESFPTDKFTDMNFYEHTDVFVEKLNYLNDVARDSMDDVIGPKFDALMQQTQAVVRQHYPMNGAFGYGESFPDPSFATSIGSKLFTAGLYAVGAIMLAYSAFSYGSAVVNFYNPDYSDIPASMVDLVVNEFGDRYIKYDAATMVTLNEKTKAYDPADLNAFGGQRWNALYFTKSYEAGKPLLASASSFKVSTQSNAAPKKHLPVHRFGESVCYDLNKHNFEYEDSIYLAIAQSDEQKSAITEVPDIIGSILSGGLCFLIAGGGVALGVFGTLGTQHLIKKKRARAEAKAAPQDETL